MLFVLMPLLLMIGLVFFESFSKIPSSVGKGNNTQKIMTREDRLKICENCRFCERDMRGMICGKTNEYADFEGECKEFFPSKKYQSKQRWESFRKLEFVDTEAYVDYDIYSVVGAIYSIVTIVICWGVSIWASDNPTVAIPTLSIVAVIVIGLATIAITLSRSKRKLIKKLLLREHKLTKEKLMDIIRMEGYYPQFDDDGGIIFKIDGDTFNVEYNEAKLSLSYVFLMFGDEREIRELATQVADNIMMSKIFITTFPDHDDIVVSISLDTYCVYDYECKKVFAAYLRIVRETIARFYRGYEAIQHTKDPQELRRGDIYEPEFRWMHDVLFKAVSEGTLDPAALTDEDWIRKNIQKNAAISYVAQEWDSFKINRVDNYGDYKLIVYQFPEPKVVPEAKYGAVLMNTQTLAIDYYTLEMTYNGKWVYGSMSTECHNNYGEVDTADLEKFIEWIFTKDKTVVASRDYAKESQETVN